MFTALLSFNNHLNTKQPESVLFGALYNFHATLVVTPNKGVWIIFAIFSAESPQKGVGLYTWALYYTTTLITKYFRQFRNFKGL